MLNLQENGIKVLQCLSYILSKKGSRYLKTEREISNKPFINVFKKTEMPFSRLVG